MEPDTHAKGREIKIYGAERSVHVQHEGGSTGWRAPALRLRKGRYVPGTVSSSVPCVGERSAYSTQS